MDCFFRISGLEVFSTEKPFREVLWIVFLGFQGLEGVRICVKIREMRGAFRQIFFRVTSLYISKIIVFLHH